MKYLVFCLLTLVLSFPAVAQESKPLSDEVKAAIEMAEGGDADAQYNLGVMYASGQGVLQDNKEAEKWFRKAADQGHADAQFFLGAMYAEGQGVLQDLKEAVKWFRKAADQGHATAQFNLGLMYKNGQGVLQDYVAAYAWYSLSAYNGYDDGKAYRDSIAKEMTPEQLEKGQELSRELLKQIEAK